MRVRDIMQSEVRTIRPDRPLLDASELMRIRGIRHLVVVEGSEILGVISNRDLAAISRRELEQVQVRDVMLRHVITITPDATIAQAANKMRSHKVGCLPVLEGAKLAGIITTTDLLDHIARGSVGERPTVRDRHNRHKTVHP